MIGKITTILHDKGFGFVLGEDNVSRFFHANSVAPRIDFDYLQPLDRVAFDSVDFGEQNPAMRKGNGLRAVNIRFDGDQSDLRSRQFGKTDRIPRSGDNWTIPEH